MSDEREGSDVPRSVDVPVVVRPAAEAVPLPVLQGEAPVDVAADMAPLGRRIEPADGDDILALAPRLVRQEPEERPPGGSTDALGKAMVLRGYWGDHVLHGQTLDSIRRRLVLADKTVRDLVEKVGPLACYFFVKPCQLLFAFLTAVAAFLLAGEGVLDAPKFLRNTPQVLGVGDPLAAAGDEEVLQPHVQAECVGRDGSQRRLLTFLFHQDAGEVPARGRPRNRHGLDPAREPAVELGPDALDLRDVQDALLEVHGTGLRALEGLPGFSGLERRVVGVPLEEGGEGRVQVPQGHLEALGVDCGKPGQFGFEFREAIYQDEAGEFLLPLRVGSGLLFQAPVEDVSGSAEVPPKPLRLLCIGVQSELVGSDDHRL